MSQLVVQPGSPLRGQVSVPGDKSITHRALLLGAIAEGTSRVAGFSRAADCGATLRAVQALGCRVEQERPSALVLHGQSLRGLQEAETELDCGRSATSMRLLAGCCAGFPFLTILSGDSQLLRRPMDRVVEPLRQMGATVLGRSAGRYPPLALHGGTLHGIDYTLPVASAQAKSALLLAGLYADGLTCLHVPGPARDHTERMLIAMGCDVRTARSASPSDTWHLQLAPPSRLQALDITVPGDLSSAAFLIVAATLVPGSEIVIQNVGVNPTRTGLLEVLWAMGAQVRLEEHRAAGSEPVADLGVHASGLRGTMVGGELTVRAIDELPLLAVAATQADGETIVRDAAELRVKETDRIAGTVQELRRLGADIESGPDGFVINGPTPLLGGTVFSHGDHRLAMALAVAGLVARGLTVITDADCIADSFPGFEVALASLGGQLS